MRLTSTLALAAALCSACVSASDDKKEKKLKPCTIKSPTDRFFDLNPINVQPSDSKKKKSKSGEHTESWHAKGYDYPANFTLNFCGPVVEELDDVVGLDNDSWRNVSAYYTSHGKTYSIGQENSKPIFRGRKLVLEYTGGSPCSSDTYATKRGFDLDDLWESKKTKKDDDDDDDDDDKYSKNPDYKSDKRRKSTVISLLCETDSLAAPNEVNVAFVAASPDECTYFFEARSKAACGGIEVDNQQLGPGGVFGVIALIAVLVYFVGGCVYQRTVMHQRGWRQIPNFSFWNQIWTFLSDMFIILTSSCARFFPSRQGYNRVSFSGDRVTSRRRDSDDENRLIDELDESWND
ncbi:mannose-6-phosphate receptor binding domain-containing protein [Phyllosticta citriasiana]|uniref:Mannose-6-phosphate receptor binding domain-containing protein n=1 Tax=Phyllosticta citriasiana TaxID=595635 RepID=A0ABR1L0Y0_9PEZI